MLIRKDFLLMAIVCCVCSVGAREYQGIVYGLESSKPVQGVLVSLGHTRIRTYTDQEGKFFLDSSETGTLKVVNKAEPIKISWNHRNGLINLSNASSINRVSIYDLNGRVLFKTDITLNSKSIKVPLMARGIYLLSLRSNSGAYHNFKINSSMPSALLSINRDFSLRQKASVSQPVKLLFRHDEYFPVDYEVQDPDENMVVIMKNDPRSMIFDPNQVHSFNFTITAEDSLKMEKEALLEQYIPAQLNFNGQVIGKVGLRYKGSSYSLGLCFDSVTGERSDRQECNKISLKVKFNKFESLLRFYEMKELNLHAMSFDGSKMRDMLAYEMYRDMGIYGSRTSYAKIYVNGVFQGIYVAVEAVDGRFTKSRWPEGGDGNLYKEAWPYESSLSYYYHHLETNNDDNDSTRVSRMVDFYNAINTSTVETFNKNVEPFIDFNYLMRYLAVDRAIKNWDGITGWYDVDNWLGNHNFFFYEEEKADGKMWLIPWDLDNTFQRNDPFIDDADVPNWNQKAQSCGPIAVFSSTSYVRPSNCDKFTAMTAANYWEEFVKTGNELLRKIYKPEKLINKVDNYVSLIDTIIKNDSAINYKIWKNEVSILKRNIRSLHNRFYEYVNEIPDIIDTSDFSIPFTGEGRLAFDRTNNFEFAPVEGEYPFSDVNKPKIIDGSITHSTENPIWGTADLLFSFIFNPMEDEGSYSEWIRGTVFSVLKSNIENCKEIKISLCADKQRYLWVGLYSKASEYYGWAVYVNDFPKTYTFRMDEISYPTWSQSGDPELLSSVLKAFSGINFTPSAMFDSQGELPNGPDTGFLRIDNIQFIF